MPTISMFYGIIIHLYFFDNQKHHTPHFHARYQGQLTATTVKCLRGRFLLPR